MPFVLRKPSLTCHDGYVITPLAGVWTSPPDMTFLAVVPVLPSTADARRWPREPTEIRMRRGRDVPHTLRVIALQPVLETYVPAGFDLWPVADSEPYGFLPLNGALDAAQVGTAVMRIAACNDIDPEHDDRPPHPGDPLGSFLHGLLTMDPLFASGGLRITDTAIGATLVPGCCSGLEDWREWFGVLDGDGGSGWFGHDPSPLAERVGDVVRLTVDAERDDSPVIEVSVTELRRLLAGAQRDLADFLQLAAGWAAVRLPGYVVPVTAALARAVDMPMPAPACTPRRTDERR